MRNRTNYIFLKAVELFLSLMMALLPFADSTSSSEIVLAQSTGYIVLFMFILIIALAIVEILVFYKSNSVIAVIFIVTIAIGWAITNYGQSLGNEIIWLFGCGYTIYLIMQIVYLLIRRRIRGKSIADSNLPYGHTSKKNYLLYQSISIAIYFLSTIICVLLITWFRMNINACLLIAIGICLILQFIWFKQYAKINIGNINECFKSCDFDSLDKEVKEILSNPIHPGTKIILELKRCNMLGYIDVIEAIEYFKGIEAPKDLLGKKIYYETMLELAIVNQDYAKAEDIVNNYFRKENKKTEAIDLLAMVNGNPTPETVEKFKVKGNIRSKNIKKAYYLLTFYLRTNHPDTCMVAQYILDQNTGFNEINRLALKAKENKN